MRILFVTASYLPTVNGVSFQIQILKKALEDLGHKVYVLAPKFPGYEDKEQKIIRYPSIPNPIVKKYPVGIPLVSFNKIKKIRPEIVHVHHPFIFGQYAAQIAKKLRVPLVFTAHTQYQEYLNHYFPSGIDWAARIIKNDLQNLAGSSEKIICPSLKTQEKFNTLGIKNTVVINNSIENSFFRKNTVKKNGPPTLAFTGRLDKEKNLFFLLKVMRELKNILPNFQLIVVGNGQIAEALWRKTILMELQENILSGEVNRNLLPSIYQNTHLFISLSTSEVMPLSLIEALASGLPIIALEKSGLNELVINGETGLLLPANQKLIAEKIKSLLTDQNLIRKMSLAAFNHAQKFAVANKAREIEKLYTAIISGK